jgi:hypothetical protein
VPGLWAVVPTGIVKCPVSLIIVFLRVPTINSYSPAA